MVRSISGSLALAPWIFTHSLNLSFRRIITKIYRLYFLLFPAGGLFYTILPEFVWMRRLPFQVILPTLDSLAFRVATDFWWLACRAYFDPGEGLLAYRAFNFQLSPPNAIL
jgi:hypothetical protein